MFHRNFSALVVAGVVAAAWVLPAGAGSGTVIVMPARTRVVQLAFQVARVSDVGLVAYNNSPSLAAPLIHAWNGREWVQIGLDEYVSGTFLPSAVDHVFILGDSTSLPAAMTGDPKWAAHVHKTADLNVASLLNEFGPVLKFGSSQWRWLAEQNGLDITDRNVERRRYGRWGKSGSEAPFKPAPAPAGGVPPEPPVTDLKQPTQPVSAPAAKVEAPQAPTPVAAPVAAGPKAPEVSKEVKSEPAALEAVPLTPVPATSAPAAADPTSK